MYYLGLDLGGTKMEAAVISERGLLISSERVLTHAQEGSAAVLERMFVLLDAVLSAAHLEAKQISGLGVGVPGAVDHATGIILDGRLHNGATGSAGEVGHMVLLHHGERCNCGNIGCWESISSGPAIAKEAMRRMHCGEESTLSSLAHPEKVTAEDVFAARERGDRLAIEVTERALYFLGLGIANLVNALNPERVVLGGGVAGVGELLITRVKSVVEQVAYGPAKSVKILPASLKAKAGVIGAAALAIGPVLPNNTFWVGQEP
ncbi:MAG: Glucokinase [Firmicutes bacterium]|nr:Glucokinase [Bacillota bacterium]